MKSNFPIFSLVVYAFSVISKTSRYFKALSFNQKKNTPKMKICCYHLLHALFPKLLVVGPKEEINSLTS